MNVKSYSSYLRCIPSIIFTPVNVETVLMTSKGTQSMEATVISQPTASPHGGYTKSSYVILVYLIKLNKKVP